MTASALMAASDLSVRVSWSPNAERNLAGYEVRFGTASQKYTQTLDAGNKTEVVINGLDATETYYKIVLACQFVWVPKNMLQPSFQAPQNGAPLPTRIVN